MGISGRDGATFRSVILGIGMVLVVCIGSLFSFFIVGSSEPTWSYFPSCVGFPFVVVVLGNALCRRMAPSWALGPAELLIIVTMGLVVSGIPIFMLSWGLAIIAAPYYHATPENSWVEDVHPYLPEWTLPQNKDDEAMVWFFEGLPSGQAFPWDVWVSPMLWWISVMLAVYLVSFCLVVIFRRQWVEYERLSFPMAELPQRLVAEGSSSLLGHKSFWIGCGAVLAIMLFNMISYFEPGFPEFAFHRPIAVELHPDFPVMKLVIYLPVLGFMFLAPTNISFSIWFFYLIAIVQEGIVNRLGIEIASFELFAWGLQTLTWQAWGAFTAMVLWSVWMSRRHLTAIGRHVLRRGPPMDDRGEMISYRAASYCLLAGLIYIVWWMCRAGMDLSLALLLVFTVLVAYIGITRLVIQSGLYCVTMPITGQAFVMAVTGTSLAPANIGGLSVTYSWFGDVQSLFMPSAALGAKLNEARNRRLLAIAMGLAVVVGFASCLFYVLHLCYEYGAYNLTGDLLHSAGEWTFHAMDYHLDNPQSTDWWRLTLFSIGALVYSALTICQCRFAWWPLHPVGLAVSSLWMIHSTVVSVFLAWAVKTVAMYIGGIAAYRRLRPLFLGLITGYFLGIGASFLVDWIWFFGKGHPIIN